MKNVFAALTLLVACATAAHAQTAGDPAKGEQVFKKCRICHQVGENAKNMVGPYLNNMFGAQPGTHVQDYKYSPAMTKWGEGKVWDDATLDAYLENPRGVVPGTKMAFVGLKDPQERADVIAYLHQFSEKKQ
jgi:cytochrome c